MTVDEYLAWAEGQPGRYELWDGVVCAMSPKRLGHVKMKLRVARALEDGIRRAGLPCDSLGDGATVRIDRHSAYEPDALVYCGPKLPRSAIEVPNPIIVVEALSPSTRRIDAIAKLEGYFKVASVRHYLIIDPDVRTIIHYERRDDSSILTHIVKDGDILFAPPGLSIAVGDLYPDDEFPPEANAP